MVDITQRSFTGGEVSPAIGSRADIAKYQYGLSLCKNFFVRAQGGVYNRPGFRFIGGASDDASTIRLIPFQFNTDQTYILVFENLKIRICRSTGFLLDNTSQILEITTPYTSDELFRIGFTQTEDVMTLVHPSHAPMNLSRLADDDWRLETQDFTSGITPPVLNANSTTGDIAGGGDFDKRYQYVVTAVSLDGEESVQSNEQATFTNSLSQTYGIRLSWSGVASVDYYRVYKDPSESTGIYGWIGDSESTVFNDFNIAPITSDTPPRARNPFDSSDNYPGAVTHFAQRRIYARTNSERQTFFATQTGQLNSLRESIPARATDAVTFRVFSNEANEIRYIVEAGSLIILTSGAEFVVSEGENGLFTPDTVSVRRQSNNGTAWVTPVVVNDTILYVQEKASRIRDLNYDFGSDRFRGNDLSIFAEHLFEDRLIVDMAYTDEPYSILWCVMDDGSLMGLTYLREQEVIAWHQHETDGKFESVASISEDNENILYAVVKRTIDGVEKRYVERMESRLDSVANDVFYVDSGLKYDGVPVTTVSGLDHLEGQSVVAVADGNVVKNLTVESGSVTLPIEASKIVVGLNYTSTIETLDIDSPQQTLKGINTSVSKVAINFEQSRGGFVGPKKNFRDVEQLMVEIKPRFESDSYNTIALKSFQDEVIIDPKWGRGGGIRIEQRDPLPMGILALTPDASTS